MTVEFFQDSECQFWAENIEQTWECALRSVVSIDSHTCNWCLQKKKFMIAPCSDGDWFCRWGTLIHHVLCTNYMGDSQWPLWFFMGDSQWHPFGFSYLSYHKFQHPSLENELLPQRYLGGETEWYHKASSANIDKNTGLSSWQIDTWRILIKI